MTWCAIEVVNPTLNPTNAITETAEIVNQAQLSFISNSPAIYQLRVSDRKNARELTTLIRPMP